MNGVLFAQRPIESQWSRSDVANALRTTRSTFDQRSLQRVTPGSS